MLKVKRSPSANSLRLSDSDVRPRLKVRPTPFGSSTPPSTTVTRATTSSRSSTSKRSPGWPNCSPGPATPPMPPTERVRSAVVTGGGGGIGRATVERLLRDGLSVVVGDLNADRGAELLAELDADDRLRFLRVDVSSEDDMAALVTLAVESSGGLDVMFNNA